MCIMCAQYSCDLPVGIKGICCCSGACYCCKLFSQALKLKCKITSFYDAFFLGVFVVLCLEEQNILKNVAHLSS